MIGGMISSTVLTLVVIPAIYAVVKDFELRRADRSQFVAMTRGSIVEVDK
jgi:Cu(I)/Ag(I) efflux system membrane protein CusA/SilA